MTVERRAITISPAFGKLGGRRSTGNRTALWSSSVQGGPRPFGGIWTLPLLVVVISSDLHPYPDADGDAPLFYRVPDLGSGNPRKLYRCRLMLASPFAAWNFLIGQNGFLTASLLRASLLLLERRPVLAGVFIGCLTYKPQFGIFLPVALIAARQWRACVSAAVTVISLVAASAATFGVDGWVAFPRAIFAEGG